ncbi:hypothetical protein [Agarivorans sp. 1_MG-2023]|uniref:hypothetical protein n=1 Tax=Agarivorans sp. 1_MG-2023 TaxID=3062634 RepID=UPI0026E16A60|nr:hypothetical protein [Agarivorans sp. 1_MG-2023]MDO6764797.1 hypothetical protein [Agarivorans sp. 1_MG-2023]
MSVAFYLSCHAEARRNKNYKVVKGDATNGKCLVCFSSNAIFYPHTDEGLRDLLVSDYYEWERLVDKTKFEKILFFRDVYKQWYINGISERVTSVEALGDLIKHLTFGLDSTFVGSSAGGYAAVMFGDICSAKKIFSFSGQFNLSREASMEKNPILASFYNHSFDYSAVNKEVFYFYPAYSEDDIIQAKSVEGNSQVIAVKVNDNRHGVPILPFSLKKMLLLELKDIKRLSEKKHSKLFISMKFITWRDLFTFSHRRMQKLIRVIRG